MIFLYFLIKGSLDFIYCSYIFPIWGYMGFALCRSNDAIVISYVYVFLLSISVPVKIKTPSDFFLHILALCPLMPMLIIYAFSFATHGYMAICMCSFFIIWACAKVPFQLISPKSLYKGYKIALCISIFFIALVTIHIIAKGGLRFFNLKLSKVYEFRRASAQVIAQGLFAYLNNWVFKVFNMFLLTWGLYKNKRIFIVISLLLQVFFFAISAHKSVLFSPILILLIRYISSKKQLPVLFSFFYLVGIWCSSVVFFIFNNLWPLSLIVRRALFVPAFLNFKYYLFFQNNPLICFSNSVFLKRLIQYPYDLPVPLLISKFIGHNPESWANTGFLGTGYAQLGCFGVIIYSILIGFILRIVNNSTKTYPSWVGASLIAIPIFSVFTSSDLTTGLLTHGLALGIFLLWLTKANITKPI
jgi:hypothetical protein